MLPALALVPALALLVGGPLAVAFMTVAVVPNAATEPAFTLCGPSSSTALPAAGEERRASLTNQPTAIPDTIRPLYQAAAERYRLPWPLLAGIGMAETNHGRLTATSTAGAQGLMQFLPATFTAYGVDGDNDGQTVITNDADSIFSAAHYLAASGAAENPDGVRRALLVYNQATWYVNDVLTYAHHYANEACTAAALGSLPDGPDGPCPPSGSGAENGLQPNALRALRCVKTAFPWITNIGGIGDRPNKSDHPAGRAIDLMIPGWETADGRKAGWQVAHWLQANATNLNVKYLIYDDHVWRSYRADVGWTPYTHPNGPTTDPTLRHLDHVHVSVND